MVAVGSAGDDVAEREGQESALAVAEHARTRPDRRSGREQQSRVADRARAKQITTGRLGSPGPPFEGRGAERPDHAGTAASESSRPAFEAETPCASAIVGNQLSVA